MHAPFRRHRCLRPVRDHFVRDGSAPLALAAVVADDRRFGRAVDNDDDGSPLQSVLNIDSITTSSLCSSSLLVSIVFVVVLLLPKRPSQSQRRTTSKNCASTPRFHIGVVVILRCNAAAVVALPILPPNEQLANVDPRHQHRRGCRTPPCRAATPLLRRSSGGGSRPPGVGGILPGSVGGWRRHIHRTPPHPSSGTVASLSRTAVGSVTNDGGSGDPARASGATDTSGQLQRRQRRRRWEKRCQWWQQHR